MSLFVKNTDSFQHLVRVAVALAVATIAFTGSVPAQDVGTATEETLSAADVKRPYCDAIAADDGVCRDCQRREPDEAADREVGDRE